MVGIIILIIYLIIHPDFDDEVEYDIFNNNENK